MMRALVFAAGIMIAAPAMAEAPVPDAGRLTVAKSIAARMLPDGTFEKVMGSMMDGVMNSVMDGMMDVPISSIAKWANQPPEKIKALGPATFRDMMAIIDPAYRDRFQITAHVMGAEMGRMMTKMEPTFREAMVEVYAARFDEKQLREIDAFFQTPTGRIFAEQSMTMQTDPAFMNRMKAIVPEMMQAMPAIMEKVAAATAGLPKPRNAQDLSADEKKRIVDLLGAPPQEVK
jgi:hypothetical protein